MNAKTIKRYNWTELSLHQQSRISEKTAELLACLERDILHIKQILKDLDKIRSLVVKRDENSLKGLLQNIQVQTDEYKEQEARRRDIRGELARLFNWSPQQLKLSELETVLPEILRSQVKSKKVELQSLTERLKKEHLSTVLLLAECARFNRLVLRSIFDCDSQDVVTYSSGGTKRQRAGRNFMNFKI